MKAHGVYDFVPVFSGIHWMRFVLDRALEGNFVLLVLNCLCSEKGFSVKKLSFILAAVCQRTTL